MYYILDMIDVALATDNMQELDMINLFIDRMIRKLERGLSTSEVRWAAEAPY